MIDHTAEELIDYTAKELINHAAKYVIEHKVKELIDHTTEELLAASVLTPFPTERRTPAPILHGPVAWGLASSSSSSGKGCACQLTTCPKGNIVRASKRASSCLPASADGRLNNQHNSHAWRSPANHDLERQRTRTRPLPVMRVRPSVGNRVRGVKQAYACGFSAPTN